MIDRRKLLATAGALTGLSLISVTATAAGANRKLLVIGATSRSGREIIAQALEQGYTVTGLARSPDKLGVEHPNLTLVKGDVRDAASLAAAMHGDEVVICMAGYPTPKDPTKQIGAVDLYTVMAGNLIEAMRSKGNHRLIMASSTGVETRVSRDAQAPVSEGPGDLWRYNARYLYADMADMEDMLLASGLDVILLRPVFMTEDVARGNLQFSTSGQTPGGRAITYPDFAAFILTQVESDQYLGKAVSIYSDSVMDPAAELRKFQEKMRQQSGQK